MERPNGDRGDIVLGWMTKLVSVLAVVGLVGFDAVSIGVGRLKAEDRANHAARAAQASWDDTADVQQAYLAALGTLDDPALDTIDPADFAVAPDGSVTLTLAHHAETLVAEKIGPLEDVGTTRATVTAFPPR